MVKRLWRSGEAWPGWGWRGKGRQRLQGSTCKCHRAPREEEGKPGRFWKQPAQQGPMPFPRVQGGLSRGPMGGVR